jgi:hypothetical protein
VQKEIEKLKKALEQSVKLQSHYAEQLNMRDGGKRMTFKDADDWMARLDRLERNKMPVICIE